MGILKDVAGKIRFETGFKRRFLLLEQIGREMGFGGSRSLKVVVAIVFGFVVNGLIVPVVAAILLLADSFGLDRSKEVRMIERNKL